MQLELTSYNVETIFKDCLFKEGENTAKVVVVEGVISKFGFHPERLNAHKDEIKQLLQQLPDNFRKDKGGGWSFLQACVTKNDHQWGEHRNIEQLLVLGIATDQAKICLPREMWSIFPGGMPYFMILV